MMKNLLKIQIYEKYNDVNHQVKSFQRRDDLVVYSAFSVVKLFIYIANLPTMAG